MKYNFCAALAFLLLISLAACDKKSFSPSVPNVEESQQLVDSLVYRKAKNGLCFGITVVESSIHGTYTKNVVLTAVDCNRVGL